MEVRFAAQPFLDEENLHDFLSETLGLPEIERLDIVTAWAKYSGLARMEASLRRFGERGGVGRLIVGIDEGGATEQGLRFALELFGEVRVFHDPDGRTFHPKLYLGIGPALGRLYVGSSNATAGGLFFNYEAGLIVDLDLDHGEDAALADEVVSYVDRLREDAATCILLTPSRLEALLADPQYRIGDERRQRRPRGIEDPSVPDVDTAVGALRSSMFARSQQTKRADPAPLLRATGRSSGHRARDRGQSRAPAVPVDLPPRATALVEKRWFKQLEKSDAQYRERTGTHPTGKLRLSQEGHPIDKLSYFRRDFFSGVGWEPEERAPGIMDVAKVPFQVTIDGQPFGIHRLRVDHAPWRVAGQGNVPTVLGWGPLSPVLRSRDFRAHWVTLERLVDGTFNLEIALAPTGPFLA